MNLSSQDTIIDTLTLFLPHCHSLTKPNLEVWPGPARKRKKLSTVWGWNGVGGGSKERHLSKKGEGDSTQYFKTMRLRTNSHISLPHHPVVLRLTQQ